jgi:hypothetical protein
MAAKPPCTAGHDLSKAPARISSGRRGAIPRVLPQGPVRGSGRRPRRDRQRHIRVSRSQPGAGHIGPVLYAGAGAVRVRRLQNLAHLAGQYGVSRPGLVGAGRHDRAAGGRADERPGRQTRVPARGRGMGDLVTAGRPACARQPAPGASRGQSHPAAPARTRGAGPPWRRTAGSSHRSDLCGSRCPVPSARAGRSGRACLHRRHRAASGRRSGCRHLAQHREPGRAAVAAGGRVNPGHDRHHDRHRPGRRRDFPRAVPRSPTG